MDIHLIINLILEGAYYELDHMTKAAGLGRRLWLSTALSRAKAFAGPSPMAWLGLAQIGLAWLGFRLWAGPSKSLAQGQVWWWSESSVINK